MKTTIEIADDLLRAAEAKALSDGITVRDVVEQGLREVLAPVAPKVRSTLRDASFGHGGLTPEATALGWGQLHTLVHPEPLA